MARSVSGCYDAVGRSAHYHIHARTVFQQVLEPVQGAAFFWGIRENIGCEGFGSKNQHPRHRLTASPKTVRKHLLLIFIQCGNELGLKQFILFPAAHLHKFVIGVYVGLGHEYVQFLLGNFVRSVPFDEGPGYRSENRQSEPQHIRQSGLPVESPGTEAGPPSIRQCCQEPEYQQVGSPDPERTSQTSESVIPLNHIDASGEGIAEGEPGPGYVHCKIGLFPGYPGRSEENVGKTAAEGPAGKPVESPDGKHLQGVQHYCSDSSANCGIAHPEGGDCVPNQKGSPDRQP